MPWDRSWQAALIGLLEPITPVTSSATETALNAPCRPKFNGRLRQRR
jgi:hypothetical protein